jgi:hypothetical protein
MYNLQHNAGALIPQMEIKVIPKKSKQLCMKKHDSGKTIETTVKIFLQRNKRGIM